MFGTRTLVAPALAVSCLLLVGCGPTTAAPTGAAPAAGGAAAATPTAAAGGGGGGTGLVACDLLTEADATAAIGEASGPGTPGGGPALSECLFDDGALIVSMKTDSKAMYDQERAGLHAGKWTDLPDVGDGGFAGGAEQNVALAFIKGTTLVSILLNAVDGSPMDHAVALAKIAAGHIS
jgi:hypothetical protein